MRDYEETDNPHVIQPEFARFLEVDVIKNWAKRNYEVTGEKVKLKVCISGPLELYFKKIGFGVYKDMAMQFSESVNRFLKNSIIKEKYIETTTVAIDEPSLGYVTISGASDDDLIAIYDKSVEGLDVDVQIHLHSLNSFKIPLQTKHINIMTSEFASNPKNVIDKKYLDDYDKFMRVGITRTNLNAIMADALDSGMQIESPDEFSNSVSKNNTNSRFNLIDSKARIEKNLMAGIKNYGDRLKYVGPDCGLSSWNPPELSQELLKRTAQVVQEYKKN